MAHPRLSFMKLLLSKAHGFQAATLLVLGLVVLVFAFSNSLRAMRLETGGATVTGTVLDLKMTKQDCGQQGKRTCEAYHVTYSFTPAGGRDMQLTEKVNKDFFNKLQTDGDVLVRYLPDDPSVAEIAQGTAREVSWWLGLIGGGFLLAGGLILMARAKRVRELVWLAEHGTPVTVTVERHEKGPMFQSRRSDRCATWDHQTGGAGRTDARRLADLPKLGASINVIADPRGKFAPVWEADLI